MLQILYYREIFEKWVFEKFKELKEIRNTKAVHFNSEIDNIFELRSITLHSIKLLHDIINLQFWFKWSKEWLIENTKGAFFIKKSYKKKTIY